MLNYWWVTRPKRKLNTVPEVLAALADVSLDEEWQGQRNTHLSLEEALEQSGLKRVGLRRDRTGGGARTYQAWLMSLGLVFLQETTGKLKLTLAGEAIMNGNSPVAILKNQIIKYQFPSSYSISRGVQVNERFKIRPFRFLLRLLNDDRIEYLTEEEIAKVIIVKGESETEECYKKIVEGLFRFREIGDVCLDKNFITEYASSKGQYNPDHPYSHLIDTANTFVNWLEYTQLVKREGKNVAILDDKRAEVSAILADTPPFIDRPENHEYFQRKYGLDPVHKKDTRNLLATKSITYQIIAEQKIRQAFISESLKAPISKITSSLIDKISEQTGINIKLVEESLQKLYPHGAIGSFMTEYFELAFKGREEAREFELATVELFKNVFGFEAQHVGPVGLAPDVLILSDDYGYAGIIDNKAYSKYSITNDHRNRMVYNYIPKYSKEKYPLAFFSYLSGGFGKNINAQIMDIVKESHTHGSAISVTNMIRLVEIYSDRIYGHSKLKALFSLDKQILSPDIDSM